MKTIINMIIGFAISMVLQSAGVTPDTWQFWVVLALILGLVVVACIPW